MLQNFSEDGRGRMAGRAGAPPRVPSPVREHASTTRARGAPGVHSAYGLLWGKQTDAAL